MSKGRWFQRLKGLGYCVALIFMTSVATATTVTIDGIISPGEYGPNNQLTNAGNTGQTWEMTWDATNLYVAIADANLSEGAIIYIDANPLAPPNGGTNANGNLTGFNYDNANVSSLPFRADFVTYFKDGYREYRNADGGGNWTSQTAFYGSYASSASGNVREVAIPWSAVTGSGMPTSFDFFGYLVSSGGYVYGQAPSDNPGAFIGTSATYTHYFVVTDTSLTRPSPPFGTEGPTNVPDQGNTSALLGMALAALAVAFHRQGRHQRLTLP
jgi:hypothetical protein